MEALSESTLNTNVSEKQLTFDDIQIALNVIPTKLTETFDKRALDIIIQSGVDSDLVQEVIKAHGKLVHSFQNGAHEHDNDDKVVSGVVKQMKILEEYSRKGGADGRKSVTYFQKSWDDGGCRRGRRFAPKSLSLQSISRPVRHTIAALLYFDADMKNCHPVALEHFCRLHDIEVPLLHQYNTERDARFHELMEATSATSMPMDKDACKTLMLKIVNGGKIRKQLDAWGEQAPAWVEEMYHELGKVRERIAKIFPAEYADAVSNKKWNPGTKSYVPNWNPSGTLVNRLLNVLEDNALQYIFKFFKEKGHMPEVLCFDGLMVPRRGFTCEREEESQEQFDELCEQCTQYVQDQTGYPFVIVRKDMDEGFRDALQLDLPHAAANGVNDEEGSVDADGDDMSHLDDELRWLVDHLPVDHFDKQDHGIYQLAMCMLHLKVPKAVIRDDLSISLHDVESAFARYNSDSCDYTKGWLKDQCASAGEEHDVTRHLEIRSRVNKEDEYYWLDFLKETHHRKFETYQAAQQILLSRLPRILSVVTAGKGMVVVKDNTESPFAMKCLRDLLHTVSWMSPPDDEGKREVETQPLSCFIKKHLNSLPCFSSIVFKPNDVGLRKTELNTWPGFRANIVGVVNMDLVNPWLDHIRHVWADGNEDHYRYILSWLRHVMKHPETPSGIALVMQGAQGAGKTLPGDFLADNVFGRALSLTTTGLDSITARFNACFMSKVFVNANELTTMSDSYHSAFDKMKAFITDKTVQIEQKNKEHITINNCANFLCTTNHDWTVKLEAGDRRYACFTCSSSRLGDQKYFTRLAACMTDEHGDHFFTYLTTMFQDTVSLRNIPKTELRVSMMDSSKPASVRFMEEFTEYPEMAFKLNVHIPWEGETIYITRLKEIFAVDQARRIMDKDTLYAIYCEWARQSNEKTRSKSVFCREIKAFVTVTRPTIGSKRVTSYELQSATPNKRPRLNPDSEVPPSDEQ